MQKPQFAYSGTSGSASWTYGEVKTGKAKDGDSFILAEIPRGVVLTHLVLETTPLGQGANINVVVRDEQDNESEVLRIQNHAGPVNGIIGNGVWDDNAKWNDNGVWLDSPSSGGSKAILGSDHYLDVLSGINHDSRYLIIVHVTGGDVPASTVFSYRIETGSLGIG